jgi:quercetin dioxygenase-like cupin family protein
VRLGDVTIVDRLAALEMERSRPPVYDRDIELRLLYQDPVTGAEHYVVRYPAGLRALPHRHSSAHTIVVVEGRMVVNDAVIGPGAYAHFPAGEAMFHAPADDEGCVFVIIFHGPYDVEEVTETAATGG